MADAPPLESSGERGGEGFAGEDVPVIIVCGQSDVVLFGKLQQILIVKKLVNNVSGPPLYYVLITGAGDSFSEAAQLRPQNPEVKGVAQKLKIVLLQLNYRKFPLLGTYAFISTRRKWVPN